MVIVTAWGVGGILFLLSGIHVYWVAGGRRGIAAAIPDSGSERLFQPSKTATIVVAVALALAGWLVLELGGVFAHRLFPEWVFLYGGWALSLIFILRSVGDFRWVGFFKKQRSTLFAKWDNVVYSPLCLFIGMSVIMLVVNH